MITDYRPVPVSVTESEWGTTEGEKQTKKLSSWRINNPTDLLGLVGVGAGGLIILLIC